MQDTISINQKLVLYKRKLTFMGTTTDKEKISIKERLNNWHKDHTFMSSVLASITASAILGVIGYVFAIRTVENLTTYIDTKIDGVYIALGNINQNNSNNTDNSNNNNSNNDNSNNSGTINNYYYYNKNDIDPYFENIVKETFSSDTNVFLYSANSQFLDSSQTVATNTSTGQIYTVGDLQNQTIAFNYAENGQDIFFKGQFDENGYWDGNCIINRYQDGKLIMVMDAIYNSGTLISYEQVFTYRKPSGYYVWAIANREIKGDIKDGYTWTYYKYDDYLQKFDTNLVQSSDIINIKEFKTEVELFPEGYYSGYTRDGYYDDETGGALLIKYFEPGVIKNTNNISVIRTFYQGKIVNGQFDDDGIAWYITREKDTDYMYYIGSFHEGNTSDPVTKDNFKNNLTHEQIDEYLKQYGFLEYSDYFVTEYENQE